MRRLLVPLVAAVATVALTAPAGAAKEQTVSVKLTSDGCPKPITVKPGSVTFKVSNVIQMLSTSVIVLPGRCSNVSPISKSS